MIKGCQREMVLLQTKESPVFESAYFVLRRGKAAVPEREMLIEANRLIGEGNGYFERRKRRVGGWRPFLLGVLAGGGVTLLVLLSIFL